MLDRGQFVFQFCLATEQRKWCFHDTTVVQPAEQPAALCTRSLTECADFAQCAKNTSVETAEQQRCSRKWQSSIRRFVRIISCVDVAIGQLYWLAAR